MLGRAKPIAQVNRHSIYVSAPMVTQQGCKITTRERSDAASPKRLTLTHATTHYYFTSGYRRKKCEYMLNLLKEPYSQVSNSSLLKVKPSYNYRALLIFKKKILISMSVKFCMSAFNYVFVRMYPFIFALASQIFSLLYHSKMFHCN